MTPSATKKVGTTAIELRVGPALGCREGRVAKALVVERVGVPAEMLVDGDAYDSSTNITSIAEVTS
jgi:hypothetical protein